MILDFSSGTIGMHLPEENIWFYTLKYNPVTKLLLEIIKNSGLFNLWSNLDKIHSIYRQPARLGNVSLEHCLLYRMEIFKNDIK